jgi:hypothetical protein
MGQNSGQHDSSAVLSDLRLPLKYGFPTLQLMHAYEVRPRKDRRGVDLISDLLPFGRLGMASQIQSAMQSTTQNSTAAHMLL